MLSELPKVLIQVRGRPMIDYVLEALAAARIWQVVVVVGYREDLVIGRLVGRAGMDFATQHEQLGTGHAVMMCRGRLVAHEGPVLVVTGDSPLIQPESLVTLLREFDLRRPACLMGTAYKENPQGLGRIIRDDAGEFTAIVEQKDATPEQAAIKEVNLSCYVFNSRDLVWALDHISPNNKQGEYYLTDCPGALRQAGRPIVALPVLKPVESLSINTPEELLAVEAALRTA